MAPCGKLLWIALLLGFGGCLAAQPAILIDQAFDRLYNFDFKKRKKYSTGSAN